MNKQYSNLHPCKFCGEPTMNKIGDYPAHEECDTKATWNKLNGMAKILAGKARGELKQTT